MSAHETRQMTKKAIELDFPFEYLSEVAEVEMPDGLTEPEKFANKDKLNEYLNV